MYTIIDDSWDEAIEVDLNDLRIQADVLGIDSDTLVETIIGDIPVVTCNGDIIAIGSREM